MIGGASAGRRRQHVAEHRLGKCAPFAGRKRARKSRLGEIQLLGGDKNKAHGVSL